MSSERSASPASSACSSEYDIPWTTELMELPAEVQLEIFCHLPNYKTATALRLCCRQLDEVYRTSEKRIFASLRQTIVAPIREYYDFLERLKLPAGSVRHPPPSGWPNITPEACAGFDKTPFAIEVLRHLPYIDNQGNSQSNVTNIGYKSNVVDYSLFTPEDFSSYDEEVFWAVEWQGDMDDEDEERISNVKHVVLLADGYESGGVVLLLDTFTGIIFEEIVRCDPGTRLSVSEYCSSRMERLRGLEEIFVPGYDPLEGIGSDADEDDQVDGQDGQEYNAARMDVQGEPEPSEEFLGEDEDVLWLEHLYRKFGWPGTAWKKDECLEAIDQFLERRVL